MKPYLVLVLFAAIGTVEGRNSVCGTINDNTTWFHSNLSVRPAMTASLKYFFQYPYVEGRSRPILTFYYHGQNSPNLREKCNKEMYGQLYNKDLSIGLIDRFILVIQGLVATERESLV